MQNVKHTNNDVAEAGEEVCASEAEENWDSLTLGRTTSPFTDYFVSARAAAKVDIDKAECSEEENPYFGDGLLDKLFSNYLPTIPIWSDQAIYRDSVQRIHQDQTRVREALQ